MFLLAEYSMIFVQISTSVPSEQTTAVSMQSVITPRDHSIVAARMGLLEMASIALVTMNFFFITFIFSDSVTMMMKLITIRTRSAQGCK